MAGIAKLIRGANSLDLNSGPYSLPLDFAPPAVSETAQIATGTMANRYGGGKLVDSRSLPRDYIFTVMISGSSNAQCEQAVDRLDAFLRSGSEDEPVYFCWKPDNNIPIDPAWGQFGAARRARILHGHCEKTGELYGLEETRKQKIYAEVKLKINPPEGIRQRVGSATGGILEDIWGSLDGISRGLKILETTTNKITNPVFGNSADYDHDWTAQVGLIASQNTELGYCLPGLSVSVKLIGTSDTDAAYLFNTNVGNTNKHSFSIYIMLSDKSAPTSNNIYIWVHDSFKATTFQNLGNGLYCAYYDNFDGIASAQLFGLWVVKGSTVYLLGAQLEEKAYHTPLCFGDLMGCAWTSAAHDSTSTRTSSSLKVAMENSGLSAGEGSVVTAVRLDQANTFPNNEVFFDLRDGSNLNALIGYYSAAVDKFCFAYNNFINEISSAAQIFASGSIFILHFTWGNGKMGLYINGVTIDDDYAYVPISVGTHLYIGCGCAGGYQIPGTFLGFRTFSRKLTTAEVVADYTNILQHISGGDGLGQRLESIPWIWTKAGNDLITNHCDADHDNFCVIGGIPGSIDAITELDMILSDNLYTQKTLWLADLKLNYGSFFSPLNLIGDLQGTDDGDAPICLGGQYEQVSVDHYFGGSFLSHIEMTRERYMALAGKEIGYICRLYQADNDISIQTIICIGDSWFITSDFKKISTENKYHFYLSPFSFIPLIPSRVKTGEFILPASSPIYLVAKGGTATRTVRGDFFQITTRPLIKIRYTGNAQDGVLYKSNLANAYSYDSVTKEFITPYLILTGDAVFEVTPEKFNEIMAWIGDDDTGTETDISKTLTYSRVYTTPRWSLA